MTISRNDASENESTVGEPRIIDNNLGSSIIRNGAISTPGKGRILIAEDHESIAKTYKIMLEDIGFEVILASDGGSCIELFDKYLATTSFDKKIIPPFTFVILDYHLPIKDGMDIAKHILSHVPSQRIVIASSYPASVISKSAQSFGISVELLQKPFELDILTDLTQGKITLEIIGNEADLPINRRPGEISTITVDEKIQLVTPEIGA